MLVLNPAGLAAVCDGNDFNGLTLTKHHRVLDCIACTSESFNRFCTPVYCRTEWQHARVPAHSQRKCLASGRLGSKSEDLLNQVFGARKLADWSWLA